MSNPQQQTQQYDGIRQGSAILAVRILETDKARVVQAFRDAASVLDGNCGPERVATATEDLRGEADWLERNDLQREIADLGPATVETAREYLICSAASRRVAIDSMARRQGLSLTSDVIATARALCTFDLER